MSGGRVQKVENCVFRLSYDEVSTLGGNTTFLAVYLTRVGSYTLSSTLANMAWINKWIYVWYLVRCEPIFAFSTFLNVVEISGPFPRIHVVGITGMLFLLLFKNSSTYSLLSFVHSQLLVIGWNVSIQEYIKAHSTCYRFVTTTGTARKNRISFWWLKR